MGRSEYPGDCCWLRLYGRHEAWKRADDEKLNSWSFDLIDGGDKGSSQLTRLDWFNFQPASPPSSPLHFKGTLCPG